MVLQNLEEIYWQLAENGKEQEEVVSLGEDRFCVFNTSPLAKYESYRQTIEKWREDEDGDYIDLTPTTYRMIDTLLRFLRIDKYVFVAGVAVETEDDCIALTARADDNIIAEQTAVDVGSAQPVRISIAYASFEIVYRQAVFGHVQISAQHCDRQVNAQHIGNGVAI